MINNIQSTCNLWRERTADYEPVSRELDVTPGDEAAYNNEALEP